MSINNDFTEFDFHLECDVCGKMCSESFDSFQEAVEWKKDKSNGWISRRENNSWLDVCPDCKENNF